MPLARVTRAKLSANFASIIRRFPLRSSLDPKIILTIMEKGVIFVRANNRGKSFDIRKSYTRHGHLKFVFSFSYFIGDGLIINIGLSVMSNRAYDLTLCVLMHVYGIPAVAPQL